MDQPMENNRVHLLGCVDSAPKFSHCLYGEGFYQFVMQVPRLSDTIDYLPVTVSERLLEKLPCCEVGTQVEVFGQLRSYNKYVEGVNRLILTVFTRSITIDFESDQRSVNEILLQGYLCKAPTFRTTPFCREITDLLIAVNRSYHKSDYIPCIAWGRNARYAADFPVGSCIEVNGRVQSREYQKLLESGESVVRTCYEVSVSTIARICE